MTSKHDDLLSHVAATFALESQRLQGEWAAGLQQTLRGLRVTGALPRTVIPNAVHYNGAGRLAGWSVRANGGPVVATIHDGHDASGDVIGAFTLTGADDDDKNTIDVTFVEGLYLEVTGAGTPVGALYVRPGS